MKSKHAGKLHAEIDATNCYFSKGRKNQKNWSKVRFLIENGQKAGARVVDFRRPGPQGTAPKYTHATKEEKGPAERKKKQERKKGQVERGDKRDLNTLEARGPANLFTIRAFLYYYL